MQKAAYLIATFFMAQSTMALAHLDEKVHVHDVFSALALTVIIASILIFRGLRRQTQRH